ncbi:transcription antitermination factor NusB [Ligilactobacillus pobuzihii]|nr:transcription antitermination factor NusB [Ligilactobacillus pobuzihii]GEN47215.1 N utilization substance protein B [Ligilactobacillus pobuzihii]
MTTTRHMVRQGAFQVLFALQSNLDADPDTVCQQIAVDEFDLEIVPEYMRTLVQGVLIHQSEIDALLAEHLSSKWSLDRLSKTDLLILRLATYEIKFESETPDKVALNEALELAKAFSDDKSRRFINGVLSNLL